MSRLHYIGLDVHAGSIAVAVADDEGVRVLGKIEHDIPKLKKLLARVGPPASLRLVYEAGPTGFGLCRGLRGDGYVCEVIAPSLVPHRPGDRVKTDRRDACGLAELSRGGLLQAVVVPEPEREALRDLVRARESAKAWEKKARQQLDKFLLRHDRRPRDKMTKWTHKHMAWVRAQTFTDPTQQLVLNEYLIELEHQEQRVQRFDTSLEEAAARLPEVTQKVIHALTALKGIRFLSAVSLVAELGDLMRFGHPTQLMSFAGVVPREHSTGDSVRRGSITKCGNTHVRRIVGEAAWAYSRERAAASKVVRSRREGLSAQVVQIAERADQRLHKRYWWLLKRGKATNKAVTAVARELLGFVWAVGVQTQMEQAAA